MPSAALERAIAAIWSRPSVPEDEAAFWEERAREGTRNWSRAALISLAAIVLWWPTDLILFRGFPETIRVFAWTRGIAVALIVATLIVLRVSARLRGYAMTGLLVLALLIVFTAGWEFSTLGPPRDVWFQWLTPIMFLPIALSLTPTRRIACGVLFVAAMVAGYFGRTPAHLHAPLAGAVLDWLLFLTSAAVVAGIWTDGLRRRAFFLQCQTNRQSEELRLLTQHLEERVQQRTVEVQRLAAHLESSREDERTKLARELHDELGQELTSLRYAVELAQTRHAADPEGTGANLDEIAFLLTRTRLATRELLTLLRPKVLDDLGLNAAVEWLARRTTERTGLQVQVSLPPQDVVLGPELSTAAFRILQEALTNAARHAQATRADLRLELDGAELIVSLADDGVGFDTSQESPGFGLLGMRERAYAVGGEIEIMSSPKAGTRIRALMPIRAREAAR